MASKCFFFIYLKPFDHLEEVLMAIRNKVTVPKCDTVSSRFVAFRAYSVFYRIFIGNLDKIIKTLLF